MIVAVAALCALSLAACGSSSTGTTTDDGRLITGTIDSASASLSKALSTDASCVGDVCGVMAYGSDGSAVEGEIDPELNQWRIRVRAGNWMFGFLDGNGQRLGFLAMNGILAVNVQDGDAIDLGNMRLRGGEMVMDDDEEGLGLMGIRSYRGQFGDRDRDGIPAEFDDDEDVLSYDPSVFDAIFIRPHDGQMHSAPCRPIKVAFSQALDLATVTSASIVVELADGTPVEGTFEVWEDYEEEGFEEDDFEVKFLPAGGLPLGAEVHVTIMSGPSGILSLTGEELPADVNVSFTVRDFGSTSITCHDPDDEYRGEMLRAREREMEGQADDSPE
jgi:hypothetical protein